MDRRLTLAAVVVLALVLAAPAYAGTDPQMAGGPHDFRNKTTPPYDYAGATGSGSEVCKACHVPHHATQDQFLWAHNYDGQGDSQAPGTLSTDLCMGCHDGTLATTIDGMSHSVTLPDKAKITLGPGNGNHPVGVTYPTDATKFNQNHTLPLEGNPPEVTCMSCHDPHMTAQNPNGLRMDNGGSALCVDCHVK